ncbi:MAG: sigma-70 family RNA polymerase sigma factor [Bacteroidetes bacterium]|nr:sigma-70 family RNA polymerase sigma factor [Bacteroidota bacterium]MBS1756020.1 sigma-70 family RNA polymerase sigma factor [Bacteroidota bacterium]
MDSENEKSKFIQLIEENKRIIYKICQSYCPDKNDREDLAQEIIYNLWKSGRQFNSEYKFSTWMYRVALNVAISFYRKEKTKTAAVPIDEVLHLADKNHENTEADEKIKLLQTFINELKALDKALMLLYLEGRPYIEIAEILGITETNVATKINRIKNNLKEKFTDIKN